MQLPTNLGKYELIEFLGGGMSQVYRARDTVIDRPVVVKILTPEGSADPEAKARFLQEARVAGNIQHDNIVSVFDFGEHEGRPFMVMEYLRGKDLRIGLKDGSWRDAANGGLIDCLKVALQIASALEYVHRMGVVHRDIKPENINLDPSGKAKLMDFGIAKTADLSLTRTGMAMGTPYYMAPEQVSGRPAAPQVDIYAWGMLVFELLTGMRAVTGGTMETVFYQILNTPLDEMLMEKAGVPAEIRALLLEATAKDSAARPKSFEPVIGALRSFIDRAEGAPANIVPPAPVAPAPTPVAQPGPAVQPGKVKESPAGPILKLSVIVYGAVAITTVLAVGTWFWMGKPKPGAAVAKEPVNSSYAKAMAQGMIYIPAGTFLSGPDKKTVALNAFLIDATEVTAGDYCDLMHCDQAPAQADLPMTNITVAEARIYAMRVGKRLPTPLEWERAARGVNGNLYPWGDAEDPTMANVRDNPSFGGKGLVGAKSFQAYPEYQMVGNAWEMVDGAEMPTADDVARYAKLLNPPPKATDPWIEMRGGSYYTPLAPNIVWDKAIIPARYSAKDIGFRCVKDPS